MSNVAILAQLLLQYSLKMQEIGTLFGQATAEGRDVSDAEVDASSLKRDAALLKTDATITGGPLP